ncbi:MAG: phosphoribosylamine--glycine ligase, partial [Nanoarchaeota archaeon]
MPKVLIIGSGGREHALGWKLAQSKQVEEIIYAPGNAGTAEEKKGRNLPIDGAKPSNFPILSDIIRAEHIDLTIVGPEAPLVAGIVDYLEAQGQKVYGPTAAAAQLEADKAFSYELMKKLGIPQARSVFVDNLSDAQSAIKKLATNSGVVLKAAGLASGKGVLVCNSKAEAFAGLEEHIKK